MSRVKQRSKFFVLEEQEDLIEIVLSGRDMDVAQHVLDYVEEALRNGEILISISEVSTILGIRKSKIPVMIRKGEIPKPIKYAGIEGSGPIWLRQDIEDFAGEDYE